MAKVDAVGAGVWARLELDERAIGREMRRNAVEGSAGASQVRDLLRRVDALGLGGTFSESRGWLVRADELSAELNAARSVAERRRTESIRALAEGSVSVSDVVAGGPLYRAVMPDGPGSSAVAGAVSHCKGLAEASARAAVSGPLWDDMVGAVGQVVAESVKIAKGLPSDVQSDDDAWRYGGKTVESWQRLRELVNRWTAVHELAEVLRDMRWLTPTTADLNATMSLVTPQTWTRYESPYKLPAEYLKTTPPTLRLAVAVKSGAGPGLYAADDADRRFRVHQSRTSAALRRKIEKVFGVS